VKTASLGACLQLAISDGASRELTMSGWKMHMNRMGAALPGGIGFLWFDK
jgi:hypothetical protein